MQNKSRQQNATESIYFELKKNEDTQSKIKAVNRLNGIERLILLEICSVVFSSTKLASFPTVLQSEIDLSDDKEPKEKAQNNREWKYKTNSTHTSEPEKRMGAKTEPKILPSTTFKPIPRKRAKWK